MSIQRINRRALVALCALNLSACTVLGPDFQPPATPWLDKWQPSSLEQTTNTETGDAAALEFWWQAFEDPALNQLMTSARQKNLSLRIAGLRILESRARMGIAGSARYPQLQQVNASAIASESRRRGGDLPDSDDSLVSYQSGFNLGWELDFWGRFQRGIESADAAFFSSIANHQDVQVLLSSQVADLYYVYRSIEQRIAIAQKNAQIQKRSYEITEQVYNEGQDSELDLQQAKSQYLATLSTIPRLQIGLIKSRNALAVLLARPAGDITELKGQYDELPTINAAFVNEIPAELLLRRPDIRVAAWNVAAQSAQIGIAEADFYPSISLVGSLGWSGASDSAIPDSTSLGLGPSVSWNIFDYGRIKNNVRVQDVRLQQLIEQYQNAVLSAAREVDDAAISIVKTTEQLTTLQQSLQASQRALLLASTRYREGYSDFQRVLDAQRAVFAQADKAVETQGDHIAAVISLYTALGGGWTNVPVAQIIPADLKETLSERSDWGDLLDTPLPANSDQFPPAPGAP